MDVVKWYVAQAHRSSLPYRDKLNNAGLEHFLPTRFLMQDVGGRRVRVERPVVFNFIFVRCNSRQLMEFSSKEAGFHPLTRIVRNKETDTISDRRFVSVRDDEMANFAKTIGQYNKEVPFIKPTEVDLSKGDHVKIMAGPFEGVEGILLSQQGKDGGRVLVSISDVIAVPTLEIRPEYLQVLSFAQEGRHMYKKFDSFISKARKALRNSVMKQHDVKDVANMAMFVKRFSEVDVPTINYRLKLFISLLICYTFLGSKDDSNAVEVKLSELMPNIQSPVFRAFAYTHLYGCTRRESYYNDATAITSQWNDLNGKDKTKREIIEDLQFYKEHYSLTK